MQQPPNRLGAAMNYVASAYRYAAGKPLSPPPRKDRLVYSMLTEMASSLRGSRHDTIDTGAAMRLAVTSAWFYSGSKLIADRVCGSDAQFKVRRRTDALEDIGDHEFLRLMQQPNSIMTFEFIKRYTTFWAHLSGNAYIFISTPAPGMGPVQELWPLPANMITPLPERIRASRLTGKPIIDYQYDVGNKKLILPGENMIHIRFANPFDYWQGLSPLTAMIQAIRTDFVQARYLHGFFGRDNAVPTAIISMPTETSEVDFEVAKQQFREQFGEARRSAFIRGGDLSVQTITQTIQQMEIVNSRKFSREEINHVLGVPDGLVSGGLSGDSRLATEITFARNTVQPWLDMLAAEFTLALSPYYGEDIVIAAESVIPQDRALKVSEFAAYSQDRTTDENRKELNLPPTWSLIPPERYEELSWLIDMSALMPVRLLAYYMDNNFAAEEGADVSGQAPKAKDSGDSDTGQVKPKHQQKMDAGKMAALMRPRKAPVLPVLPSYKVEAMKLGQREELNRWKKVAMKEARDGRDPALRVFESEALPASLIKSLTEALSGVDEVHAGVLFDACIRTIEAVDLAA